MHGTKVDKACSAISSSKSPLFSCPFRKLLSAPFSIIGSRQRDSVAVRRFKESAAHWSSSGWLAFTHENGGEPIPLLALSVLPLTSLQRLDAISSSAAGISSRKVASQEACESHSHSALDSVLAFSHPEETSSMVSKLGFSFLGPLGRIGIGPSIMV